MRKAYYRGNTHDHCLYKDWQHILLDKPRSFRCHSYSVKWVTDAKCTLRVRWPYFLHSPIHLEILVWQTEIRTERVWRTERVVYPKHRVVRKTMKVDNQTNGGDVSYLEKRRGTSRDPCGTPLERKWCLDTFSLPCYFECSPCEPELKLKWHFTRDG